MTDEKKTAPETPENDTGQNGAAADPENITIDSIKDIVSISGERAYTDNGELSETAREYLHKHIAAIAAALAPDFYKTIEDVIDVTNTIKAYLNSDAVRNSMRSFIDTMQPVLDNLQPIQDLIDEIRELEPYLEKELNRPEYGEQTLENIMDNYTAFELLDLRNDPDSFFARAVEAAWGRYDIVKAQTEGRQARHAMKDIAQKSGAIMKISGGLSFFSDKELWDAFAPGRICKMGMLDEGDIDKETGRVTKIYLDPGDVETLEPREISLKTFTMLSSIIKSTVDNVNSEFVKGGNITFYVKGVLADLTDDPRTLYDNQLNLDRKTAGALYLERQFEPLQGYIGTTGNGSRYSVFNYIGYDALSDTMTIQSPYLYQLWHSTQESYFERLQNLEASREKNKRPAALDLKPLEINSLFKGKAYSTNEITWEIAVYITNVLLTAGNTGKQKKTELKYRTIIKNCPRFSERLAEIEARPVTEILPDGKKRNNADSYNKELRKIKSAFDLILDEDKCSATSVYDFISISPSKKKKNGGIEVIAPTKSRLDDKLTIVWQRRSE